MVRSSGSTLLRFFRGGPNSGSEGYGDARFSQPSFLDLALAEFGYPQAPFRLIKANSLYSGLLDPNPPSERERRRKELLKSPFLVASTKLVVLEPGIYKFGDKWYKVSVSKGDGHVTTEEWIPGEPEEVTVVAPRDVPSGPTALPPSVPAPTPDTPATSYFPSSTPLGLPASLNSPTWVPQIPSPASTPGGFAKSTGSAIPGARSGLSEWLYNDSKGLLWYQPRRGDLIPQSLPVDAGSTLLNYGANAWISLSNFVASGISFGLDIVKIGYEGQSELGKYIDRYFPINAMPLEALTFETAPAAIEYTSAWLSALSTNPRVVNAALAPIFLGTLAVDGKSSVAVSEAAGDSTRLASALPSTSAANLQHVLRGGSGARGIGVLHIDASKLTPSEIESTVEAVRDMDFQAGIADGLVRTSVPSRSVANRVAALARRVLSLGSTEAAGHLPDVAGGGSALGPIMGMPTSVNRSIGGQWGRYAPCFTFDGYSIVDRATGEFLYISHALENQPAPILNFRR